MNGPFGEGYSKRADHRRAVLAGPQEPEHLFFGLAPVLEVFKSSKPGSRRGTCVAALENLPRYSPQATSRDSIIRARANIFEIKVLVHGSQAVPWLYECKNHGEEIQIQRQRSRSKESKWRSKTLAKFFGKQTG